MLDQVKKTIERYRMLKPGDRVLVAVSGGVDSIALLHTLKELELKLSLAVAHFDHAIRPESAKDAQFVAQAARKLRLKFYGERTDVPAYARAKKLSLEVAARELRYQFLEKTAKAYKFKKIALGHNLNDQAETFLMRLLRGSGLDGLAGIPPLRPGPAGLSYIRPLIECTREQIETFARERGLAWREDPSNRDIKILRNKIRHKLLPLLMHDYNPNLLETLARTARLLWQATDYLDKLAEGELPRLIIEERPLALDPKKVLEHPEFMRTLLVRCAIERVKGLGRLESAHLEAACAWLERGGSGELHLPGGLKILRRHQRLIVTAQAVPPPKRYGYPLALSGETVLPEIGWRFRTALTLPRYGEGSISPSGDRGLGLLVAYLNADKIRGPLVVRNRRPGDRIRLRVGTKKLQDLFVDKKVPREARDIIPLICDAYALIWIVGCSVNEDYRVTSRTQRTLKITAEKIEGEAI